MRTASISYVFQMQLWKRHRTSRPRQPVGETLGLKKISRLRGDSVHGFSGPEDAAIIGDEKMVSDRLDELAASGVNEFAAVTFDHSPEGRARTSALLRTKDK